MNYEVSWNGKTFTVDLPLTATIGDLKSALETLTHVQPTNQKLLGLINKPASDDQRLSELHVTRKRKKIHMIGTADADIAHPPEAEDAPLVVDDFDDAAPRGMRTRSQARRSAMMDEDYEGDEGAGGRRMVTRSMSRTGGQARRRYAAAGELDCVLGELVDHAAFCGSV